MNTNRQFIKLTDNEGNPLLLAASTISSVEKDSPGSMINLHSIVGNSKRWVAETPEQIHAMLEPFDPAVVKAAYEKLCDFANATRFELAKVCCKHIELGKTFNAEALAKDIDGVCTQIQDLAKQAEKASK